MKTKLTLLLLAVSGGLLGGGCASGFAHQPGTRTSGAYAGVKESILTMREPGTCFAVPKPLRVAVTVLDLPFTALLDTLFLPSDLTREVDWAAVPRTADHPPVPKP